MKKVIIFDMDGVLFDTSEIVEQYFLERYPTLTTELQKEMLCGNIHEEMEKYIATLPVSETIETEEQKEVRRAIYSARKLKAEMYEGMKELLVSLHNKNFILVLNTSALERNCVPLLDKFEIKVLFDLVATAEVAKSKVEKFKIIKEKYRTKAEDMLFITDTLGDVREAEVAGVPTVAVTWGAHDEAYFNREPHENLKGVISSVADLENFINA